MSMDWIIRLVVSPETLGATIRSGERVGSGVRSFPAPRHNDNESDIR